MCLAIRVPTGLREDWRDIGFDLSASIPVAKRDRSLHWIRWGRPRGESKAAPLWPPGGWVDLNVIKSGKWWRLEPRPVVIPVMGFLIRGGRKGLWRDDSWQYPESHQAIQGALCMREGERRVYIVTEYNKYFDTKLWPRLVGYVTTLVKWQYGLEEMFPDEFD